MRRRDFITLLGSAAAWPLSVVAQQPVTPVVGWLNSGLSGDPFFMSLASAFRAGLADIGYCTANVCFRGQRPTAGRPSGIDLELAVAEGNGSRMRPVTT